MGWRLSTGECSFYRGDEVPRRTVRSSMAPAFGVAKGQGEDAELFSMSWRFSWWSWRGWAVPNAVGDRRWSARPWRVARMMSTATGRAPAREHVWGVAVVPVS